MSVALNRRQFLSSSVAGLATANVLLAQTSADRGDLKGVSSSARGWTIPRPLFGFDNADPREEMAGYVFSYRVFTVASNGKTYSLDAKSIRRPQRGESLGG